MIPNVDGHAEMAMGFPSHPTAHIHSHPPSLLLSVSTSHFSQLSLPKVLSHKTHSLQRQREMMLGKRGRGTFRRTTSMTGIAVDVEAAPPPPHAGDRFGGYDQNMMMLSPSYLKKVPDLETADFLRRCGLCRRHLGPDLDIYMYRGDTAFCSLECREQKMKEDERKERRATATANNGESHHHRELATTATGNPSKSESVAAA